MVRGSTKGGEKEADGLPEVQAQVVVERQRLRRWMSCDSQTPTPQAKDVVENGKAKTQQGSMCPSASTKQIKLVS
jgi:hypothetical protein